MKINISITKQTLTLFIGKKIIKKYLVSTSAKGGVMKKILIKPL